MKNKVEKLVSEILEAVITRPRISPFASPILLIKKKEGSWRFCIDYRKLNFLTINKNFPKPLINELLDELYVTKFFTNLEKAGTTR